MIEGLTGNWLGMNSEGLAEEPVLRTQGQIDATLEAELLAKDNVVYNWLEILVVFQKSRGGPPT